MPACRATASASILAPGFGKTANEDIVIQRETAKMASLGYPLMCAVSRKRFVGAVSGVTEAAERDAATFGVCLGAIQAGANIVRVHDVAGLCAVPERLLGGCQAAAAPGVRGRGLQLWGIACDNIRAASDMIAEIPLTCVSNSSHLRERAGLRDAPGRVCQRRHRDSRPSWRRWCCSTSS